MRYYYIYSCILVVLLLPYLLIGTRILSSRVIGKFSRCTGTGVLCAHVLLVGIRDPYRYLEGEMDAERVVRIERPDGTVMHYEGEKGAERRVRIERLGTVHHYEA